MLACVGNILEFTQGFSKAQFLADLKTIRATAFEIGMLGEAAKHIPEAIKSQHPEIHWRSIIAARNMVVHEYFRIDEEILWQTVSEDIPPLHEKLKLILDTGSRD